MRILFILLLLVFATKVFAQSDSGIWPEEINTAKNTTQLNELEREVIFELNKVRSNPAQYSKMYLEPLYFAYKEKIYRYPGQEPTLTKEGNKALMECIAALGKTPPMPVLEVAGGLIKSAQMLVKDQQFGGIGHISRDGSTPQKRMEMYGEWDIESAEDLAYGNQEARQTVIALLIDDGVPDRAHRHNVLNPKFHFVGVATGKHPNYKTMCAIDYAGDYKNKE